MSEGQRLAVHLRRYARVLLRHWGPYVALSTGLFLALAILGAAVGTERRSDVIPIRSTGDPIATLDPGSLFVHNSQITVWMLLGVVLFGLPTLYILSLNGFVIGATVADATASLGPLRTLALLAPHGVFELPAIWLAGAIGFRWLHVGWRTTKSAPRPVPLPRTFLETLFAVLIVFLLLAVAALIEGTVTAALARALT